MSTQIQFLGLGAFRITLSDGRVVMIDPCLERLNPVSPVKVMDLERVDSLLVTHLAGDHLGEAAAVAKRFRCPVVCGPEVKYFLTCQGVDPKQFRVLTWNAQTNPNGIRVRAVPSFHASVGLAPDGKWLSGAPMGFILYASDRCRIYHSGDTAIFSDLQLDRRAVSTHRGTLLRRHADARILRAARHDGLLRQRDVRRGRARWRLSGSRSSTPSAAITSILPTRRTCGSSSQSWKAWKGRSRTLRSRARRS